MTSRRAPLHVVEAAYRLVGAPSEWMQALVEAAQPALDRGCGLMATTFEVVSRGEVHLTGEFAMVGSLPKGTEAIVRAMATRLDSTMVNETWAHPLALDTASAAWERAGRGALEEWSGFEASRRLGMHDSMAAKMIDATGAGVLICAPLPEQISVDRADERRWRHVMTHVLAGLRLRKATPVGDGDAVLYSDGRVAHAEGDARARSSLAGLRAAALAIDRARTRREDPDAALHAWRGLVSGRWSLIDRFDSDGQRFLVARRNDPAVPWPAALSTRERQVLAYAALGYSNKHIAYALGLAPSTISTHLRAAIRRIGVHGRAMLAELWHAHRAAAKGS